ncbi:squalene/phytoene synthase family protein [Frigidibacter sp. MR17.14]|uniref:squalene/phytoene synthase family protein n=1 Tax=Frigidibacter sp. MR17.14 TaxID=3126509 RepID=UPI003012B515
MSLEDCRRLVTEGDPARAHATHAAPPEAQAVLWPLYALNLELARAPFASAEPMVGEMRLQWWIDTLERAGAGAVPPHHEVAGPVAELIATRGLDVAPLIASAEARKRDAWNEPFADLGEVLAHLDATAGGLLDAAVAGLGGDVADRAQARAVGRAQGAANWLMAAAELAARGREVLPAVEVGGEDAAVALAAAGLAALAEARAMPKLSPAARPALWPAAEAGAVLRMAQAEPGRIAAGTLGLSEFARRWQSLRVVMTGRA